MFSTSSMQRRAPTEWSCRVWDVQLSFQSAAVLLLHGKGIGAEIPKSLALHIASCNCSLHFQTGTPLFTLTCVVSERLYSCTEMYSYC